MEFNKKILSCKVLNVFCRRDLEAEGTSKTEKGKRLRRRYEV